MTIKICPNCKKKYETILNEPDNDDRFIHNIFPEATREQREQLISGLCSDKCRNEFTSGMWKYDIHKTREMNHGD